jgi:glycosyltransferase involved in cell wall biosynthesis
LDTWGVPPDRIHYCAQAVDNDFWIKESARCDRAAFREKLGLKGKVFLAVGQLIPRKGFDLLLKAWARLPENIESDNTVVLVGEGTNQKVLRELATQLGIRNILFVARQTSEELAKYYALADVLVFPSLVDVWGMVVNESLACGTPVLGSCFAGASQELINDSTMGELFDPLDTDGFTTLLHKWCMISSPVSREQIQARIAACHFRTSIYAIRKAVEELGIPASLARTKD